MRCLTRDELKSFLLGKLPNDFSDQISQHLDLCNTCEDTVVGLEQTCDSLIMSLRENRASSKDSSVACYEKNPDFNLAVAASQQLLQQHHEAPEIAKSPQRIGDYEILSTIGRGGMGSVYKARHMRLEKLVAIKILPHRKMRSPDAVARFNREMKIIGQMSHPAVVTAFDAGEEEGTHYLVMELIQGMDLGQIVRLGGPLPIPEACELVRQSATGVQYAHDQGVVHRDVKPSNLMLSEQGEVKLLDLGLATLGSLDGTVDELTTIGQLMGTLDYMAPEQCGSHEPITVKSDIYGLAATLYKLLTGTSPYSTVQNDTPLKKLRAMACSLPVPIRNRSESIPTKLAKVIDMCLSSEPSDRFETATEFAEAIEPFSKPHDLTALLSNTKQLRSKQLDVVVKTKLPVKNPANDRDLNSITAAEQPSRVETRSRFGNLLRIVSMAAFFGGLIWAGIVIYLQTNTGQVVIESEVEDVKVTLFKNDTPSKEFTIEHDSESTRLYAGDYRVQIDGDSDSLAIENGEFQLKRGEIVVVRIREEKGEPQSFVTASKDVEASAEVETSAGQKELSPTYEGRDLAWWIDNVGSQKIDEMRKAMNSLRLLTPMDDQISSVQKCLDRHQNELSTKIQSEIIYKIAPLATDDQIAEMLLDYCVELHIGEYRFAEYYPAFAEFAPQGFAIEPTLLFIAEYNPSALVRKINKLAQSENTRLQELAVFCAAELQTPHDEPWANPDFKLDRNWLDAIAETAKVENLNALPLMIENFPNEPQTIKLVQAQNNPSTLIYLITSGCNDRSIASSLLNRKYEKAEMMSNIWPAATSMFFEKGNSKLVDAIFEALENPDWGNEVFESISSVSLAKLKAHSDVPGHYRIYWQSAATPRQAMLRFLTPVKYNKPLMGMGTAAKTFNIPEEEFELINADFNSRMRATLYKQFELDFSKLDEDMKRQIFVCADAALAASSEVEWVAPNKGNFWYTEIPLYRGKSFEQWLAEVNESPSVEAIQGLAALQTFGKDEPAFVSKVVPLLRKVNFDGLETGQLDRKAKAALNLFPEEKNILINRGRKRTSLSLRLRLSYRTTKYLLEHIANFEEADANFLLAVLLRNRAELVKAKLTGEIKSFLASCLESDDDTTVRRGLFVSLTISSPVHVFGKPSETGLPNGAFRPWLISTKGRSRVRAILESNPSMSSWVYSVANSVHEYAARDDVGGIGINIDTSDPAKVAAVLKLLGRLKSNSQLELPHQARQRLLDPPSFLDWLIVKLLDENPEWLIQSHQPENYEPWSGKVLEPATGAPTHQTLLETIAGALDDGKCRLPWPVNCNDEQQASTNQAISNLRDRAESATGSLKKKIGRVLGKYDSLSPQFPRQVPIN